MKIAILSLVPGHNYGGILQSYALKTVLEQMGHEVKVISYFRPMPPLFSFCKIPNYCIRILRKQVKRSKAHVFAEYYNEKDHRTILQHTLHFCDRYLNLKCVKTFDDIRPNEFDAFIVGSDQVWRPMYFEEQHSANIENAYLSFTNGWNVKRIAYAPSFGVDEWEYTPEQTQCCAMSLSHFDALSVRETSGIDLCKKHLKREDAIQVCDPTMLLSKEDYERLITPTTPKSKGNLLVYCLDKSEELNKLVSRISNEKGLIPFSSNAKYGENLTVEERIMPSVESWIRAFMDAEYVITDSFHACVFSLIFHKPFLVFGNAQRGMSRFESLLDTFGQKQRMLFRADEYNEDKEYPSFDNVDEIFARLRNVSLQFLNNALR